jgi:Flp pilus assembly protein TadG
MLVKRLRKNQSGASAVEFSFLAPILAFMALGMIDVWSLASTSLAMHAAVQAGAKYLVQGGSGDSTVQSIINGAWVSPPSGHTATVSHVCKCATTAVGCNTYCASNVPPTMVYTLTASGSWSAPANVQFLNLSQTVTETQVVRVR